MKTLHICTATLAAAVVLSLPLTGRAFGNDQTYSGEDGLAMAEHGVQAEKSFHGHIVAVDASNKTLSVKGLFFTRSFNVPADCKVYVGGQLIPSIADLRPGQKVEIQYLDKNGAQVATGIVRQDDTGANGHNT